MDNSLIPTHEEMTTIQTIAKTAADSKYFEKIGGMAGLQSILLYARELGLPLMTCLFGGIRPVLGKMEVAPQMMNAMIRKAGHALKTTAHTNLTCSIYGKRKDTGEEMTVTFTIEDAKTANIYKSAWVTYPKNMLYKSALANLARWLFPDVIGMAYMEDEIQTDNNFSDKNTLDVEPQKPEPTKIIDIKAEPKPEVKINEDKVMFLISLLDGDEKLRDALLRNNKVTQIQDIPEANYQRSTQWVRDMLDKKLMEDVKGEVSV